MSRTLSALSIAGLGLALLTTMTACDEVDDCDANNCLPDCASMDASECEAEPDCAAIQGKALTVDSADEYCLDYETEFEHLGCMQADMGCTDAEVFAEDADRVGYYFSNGCIPQDFEALGEAVNECPVE